MAKTFKDLNFHFEIDSNCVTCRDGSCISNAVLQENGEEYNVCVYTNSDYTDIQISASKNSNSSSNTDIDELFTSENDAVTFLCDKFSNFKCF